MAQVLRDAGRDGISSSNRVPPHSLEAEESLLGAMLLSRDAIVAAVEARLGPGDFYRPAHGHVFEAITGLYAQGDPADPVTVAEALRRAGLLDAIGGGAALISLQAGTPAIGNAARYARIVEEYALLRRLIAVANQIGEIGYQPTGEVTHAIDQAEALVFDVAQRRVTDTMLPIRQLLERHLDHIEALYERGQDITGIPTGYLDLDQQLAGLQPSNLIIVGGRPGSGKALSVDTPIPTPTGWTTMGQLAVGDEVFDARGQPCRVTCATPVMVDRPCFEVAFDDGSTVVTDADHQWFAYDYPAWKSFRERRYRASRPPRNPALARDQSAHRRQPRVVTTQQMLDEGVRRGRDRRLNWYIPLTQPLDPPELDLPVDPYVLGCWLGAGNSTGSEITVGEADWRHFDAEFTAAGYAFPRRVALQWATVPVAGEGMWRGYSGPLRVLTRELQVAGLLGGAKKHIPAPYLRASFKQRLALVQGVLDTDGHISPAGYVELCLSDRHVLEQVRELVCSLGHKPGLLRHRRVRLPDGRLASAWRFGWAPLDPVFRLPRKAARFEAARSRRTTGRVARRAVTSIRPVQSTPVRCITVDSPGQLYLATRSMIPTHNTSFSLGLATHAALEAHQPVLIFSLEMSHLELTQRLLCSEARVDASRMRNGRLLESDWPKISHAVGRLAEAPIQIDDNPHLTVMEIRAKARRLKSREGLGLIVVDYLQLMTGRPDAENRQVEVSEISRGLKILARELNVPVVALSQLSRNLENRADKRPVLADLRESGCLTADTRLLRADNGEEVTLGELVLSQQEPMVWSLDEHCRMVPSKLTRAFPSGRKPVVRLRLASGRELEATGNHRFLTVEGWRRLDHLAVGSFLAVPRRVPAPARTCDWTDDELVLLAHLLGGGTMGPLVKYATADPANKSAVEEAARRLFGITVQGKLQGRTWRLWFPSPYRLTHGRFHPVRNWLEPHGLWGARAGTKFIPEALFGLPDDKLALFLRHLWATDGSITMSRNGRGNVVRIYYASTSPRLASHVQRALLRLGIRSRIARGRKVGYAECLNVVVSGAPDKELFLSLIGAHGARGRIVPEALTHVRAFVPDPNVDLVPWEVAHRVKRAMAEAHVSQRELAAQLGEGYCGSYLLGVERPRRFSRDRLRLIADIVGSDELSDLATSDVFWDRVTEITPIGSRPTFDATVEGTHNFIANGVVAHNSLEQDSDVVVFLYRDELYNRDSPDRGTAEVIVAKHRNGPTGVTQLAFLEQYTRFANMARGV